MWKRKNEVSYSIEFYGLGSANNKRRWRKCRKETEQARKAKALKQVWAGKTKAAAKAGEAVSGLARADFAYARNAEQLFPIRQVSSALKENVQSAGNS